MCRVTTKKFFPLFHLFYFIYRSLKCCTRNYSSYIQKPKILCFLNDFNITNTKNGDYSAGRVSASCKGLSDGDNLIGAIHQSGRAGGNAEFLVMRLDKEQGGPRTGDGNSPPKPTPVPLKTKCILQTRKTAVITAPVNDVILQKKNLINQCTIAFNVYFLRARAGLTNIRNKTVGNNLRFPKLCHIYFNIFSLVDYHELRKVAMEGKGLGTRSLKLEMEWISFVKVVSMMRTPEVIGQSEITQRE